MYPMLKWNKRNWGDHQDFWTVVSLRLYTLTFPFHVHLYCVQIPSPCPSSENQCWKQLLHHVQSICDRLQMWLSSILKSWRFEMSICLVWECTFFSCSSVERLFDPFSASLFSHHAWFYVNINIVCTENTWRWQFPGSVSFHLAVCLKLNVHISFDLHTPFAFL